MSKWLSSTNAKEIGTLYLVFAVFAGIQKITIMLALYLAICWETLLKLNIKPVYTVLELGKILYLKGLSAVNFILRDFTQDNLSLEGVSNTSYNNNFNINSKDTCSNTNIKSINTNSVLTPQSPKVKIGLCQTTKMHSSNLATNPTNNTKQNNRSSQLGNYLAGLIESDGTIIVPKEGSSNTPKMSIVFNVKDKPLALHLKQVLGYGSVQESGNAVYLVIRSKIGILDLVSLINGKFRTPKIARLHALIDWINSKPSYSALTNGGLDKFPLDHSDLKDNAWLSGFSEGDSTFQIRVTEGIPYNHVSTTYEISQGRQDLTLLASYKPIMQDIANLFLAQLGTVFLSTYDRLGKQKFVRARNVSQAGAQEVVNYFNKFPLFSSKYLDFLSWAEAQKLITNKLHLTKNGPEGLDRIKSLKNTMNNNRSVFSWEHLNDFYRR
jgi:hypothetical protein